MAEQGGEQIQVTYKLVPFSVSVFAVVANKVETAIWPQTVTIDITGIPSGGLGFCPHVRCNAPGRMI